MPTIDSFEKLFHINFRIKLNGEMVCGLIPDNDFFELTTIADPTGAPYISTYQLGPCLSTNPGPGPGLCGPHGSDPKHEDCIKRHYHIR